MAVDYEGLRKILDQFPWGILLAGEDGEILLCNDKAPVFLETDPIDLMAGGVAAAPEWSGLAEAVRTLGRDEHRRQSVEYRRGRAWYSLTVARDGLALFGQPCLVAWIAEVTRQKELEQLRSGFFTEFVRRLKGPLTSVKTSLAVLGSDRYAPLDREAREVVRLGHSEVQRLHGLLSDMGELFALEGDAAGDLYLENVEVAAILGRCLRRARKDPAAQGREITASWPDGATLKVVADYEKLGLALNHLVANALAYSPPGSPVRLSARVDGAAAEIRVEDQGIGISEADLPRVCEKFFRSSDPAVAKVEGGGLGLFIAKSYMEIMGGTLALESFPGRGTAATLRLPLAEEGPGG